MTDENENGPVEEVRTMATVHDVAAYILERSGTISAMKLQKLCYYAQAWHSTWEDNPLFDDRIEAWANGPVIPALYRHHRGDFHVSEWPWGASSSLTQNERDSIDVVLDSYGSKSAYELSQQTHSEDPWVDARQGIPPMERSNKEISAAAIQEYYLSLCAL